MCGIAGYMGHFDQTLLSKMGKLLAHRGPDAAGNVLLTLNNYTVGLAHTRLAIIDLSAEGQQPMTVCCNSCCNDGEGKLWLTYNGELYNYKQLKAELLAKGHCFNSHTDSEVLLHLYAEDGPAMLKKLNGIFAFAIYDGRSQGQKEKLQSGDLFLARDGVGVKPLYYSKLSNGFLFASELKALLACNELKRDLDLTAIHYYLAYLWCPGVDTALQSVKKLQPGEAIIVRNAHIVKQWYFYDFPYPGNIFTESSRSITEKLDTYLTQAVERQLIADVPIGAFLSGGLDSSTIVAMMKKLRPATPIHCYSIGFAEGMESEGSPNDLPYAKAVAKHLQVDLTVLEVEANMINHLSDMIYHLDEPQADPAPIHVYLIATAARRDGIKVLLSGAGGDDIFSGYRRHQAMHMENFWQWMPHFMRKKISVYARSMLDGDTVKHMQRPLIRRLAKLFSAADLSLDRRIINHFLWNTESLRRTLYSQEMAEKMQKVDTAFPLLTSLQRIPHENNVLNRMLYLEAKHFLADHNLNYTDKMAMATGVEVRVPLLDSDLIEFATRIPSKLKQKGKIGKYIFKKTMEAYLPKNIIYRPKAGFGAPLRRWLHGELQPMLRDVLSTSAIKNRGIFDAKKVANLIQADKEKRVDAAYTIFSLLCIELWCQNFIDLNPKMR